MCSISLSAEKGEGLSLILHYVFDLFECRVGKRSQSDSSLFHTFEDFLGDSD